MNLDASAGPRASHTLVTRGPYRWVRHPFYDCMALFVVSIALMMANWFVIAAGAIMFTLLAIRSRTEEDKLLERFGEPYRVYRAATRAGLRPGHAKKTTIKSDTGFPALDCGLCSRGGARRRSLRVSVPLWRFLNCH